MKIWEATLSQRGIGHDVNEWFFSVAFFIAGQEPVQSRVSALFREHVVGVLCSKYTWRVPLEAPFEKTQVKQRILNQFLLMSTAQEIHIRLH